MENLQIVDKLLSLNMFPWDSEIEFIFCVKEVVPKDEPETVSELMVQEFQKIIKAPILKNKIESKIDISNFESVKNYIKENCSQTTHEMDINNVIVETKILTNIYYCNRETILPFDSSKVKHIKFKTLFGEIEYS